MIIQIDVETSDPTQLTHCNMSDDFHPRTTLPPLSLSSPAVKIQLSAGRSNIRIRCCRRDLLPSSITPIV
ncbi:hypothetical protein CEXT_583031 [Caerostris extrusa]|uniref:Uncharacterized protein n=1 Tax=Caerostris extrusa TaxID=172846 RepID=A0AAV4TBU2_CAEEX|nr:hypothetical protein CEXT_583031 [Caerostris extrusa]